MPVQVLVADDDSDVLLALELLLSREGMSVSRADSPNRVLELMARRATPFDAVLLDLNYERDTTSGREGFSLLTSLRSRYPGVPVVVMTGWGSIEGAVEAMRRGAVDYVQKPWRNDALVAVLRGLSSEGRGVAARAVNGASGESAAMRQLHATIEQVAFSDVPVLITGEHGTGKERIARALHDRSGRKGRFVAINAGAIADGTFESELFGHVRGAFTDAKAAREGAFERATGGTLFLDEIACMPLRQQAKLLRVLQENVYQPLGASAPRPSTARIVSATNVPVEELRGTDFRSDVLYRLNTIHLHVPPLRERTEEIPALVRYFVQREATRHGLRAPTLAHDVIPCLCAHPWPGNVRELEHSLQRAVLLSARSGTLTIEHLGLSPEPSTAPLSAPPHRAPQTLRDAEEQAILRALERFPFDRRAAAESLGLSRSAFYRRLSQYGIKPPK